MNLDLTGKRALVTGSTRGIGYAVASGLAEMGATVVINGRTKESVEAALSKLRAARPGDRFEAAAGDLSIAQGCNAVIGAANDIDILVNNTGIYDVRPFSKISDAEWQRMFDVKRHERGAINPALPSQNAGAAMGTGGLRRQRVGGLHPGRNDPLRVLEGCPTGDRAWLCRADKGEQRDRKLRFARADVGRGIGVQLQ